VPFFLYLPFTLPHPGHYGDDSVTTLPIPSRGIYEDMDLPDPARSYAAMVSRIDSHVGEVLDALERFGLSENTLVFFTSDNGPFRTAGYDPAYLGSNGPYSGGKNTLEEGGIRMPMIARWTGTVPAGSVSDYAWAFWDFLPTAAEVAGVAPPVGIDGLSIAPVLRGEEAEAHPYLYWEQSDVDRDVPSIDLRLQVVRVGDWKLVAPVDEPPQLYDLAVDRDETNDVAADHPDVVARMAALLDGIRTEPEIVAAYLG
jgi:arylsulfatase A-like enzyme